MLTKKEIVALVQNSKKVALNPDQIVECKQHVGNIFMNGLTPDEEDAEIMKFVSGLVVKAVTAGKAEIEAQKRKADAEAKYNEDLIAWKKECDKVVAGFTHPDFAKLKFSGFEQFNILLKAMQGFALPTSPKKAKSGKTNSEGAKTGGKATDGKNATLLVRDFLKTGPKTRNEIVEFICSEMPERTSANNKATVAHILQTRLNVNLTGDQYSLAVSEEKTEK